MDFEEVCVCECVVAGIFGKGNEVSLTTNGDVNFLKKIWEHTSRN
jgi:hypothetical protein